MIHDTRSLLLAQVPKCLECSNFYSNILMCCGDSLIKITCHIIISCSSMSPEEPPLPQTICAKCRSGDSGQEMQWSALRGREAKRSTVPRPTVRCGVRLGTQPARKRPAHG